MKRIQLRNDHHFSKWYGNNQLCMHIENTVCEFISYNKEINEMEKQQRKN